MQTQMGHSSKLQLLSSSHALHETIAENDLKRQKASNKKPPVYSPITYGAKIFIRNSLWRSDMKELLLKNLKWWCRGYVCLKTLYLLVLCENFRLSCCDVCLPFVSKWRVAGTKLGWSVEANHRGGYMGLGYIGTGIICRAQPKF